MSGASKQANGRASGPVLTSGFLVDLAHFAWQGSNRREKCQKKNIKNRHGNHTRSDKRKDSRNKGHIKEKNSGKAVSGSQMIGYIHGRWPKEYLIDIGL